MESVLPTSRLVTSDLVIIETLNYLSRYDPVLRREAYALLVALRSDPTVDVIRLSDKLFNDAGKLFLKYSDKSWSFIDCASIVIMREWKIEDALTSDRHFEQAGFRALLLH